MGVEVVESNAALNVETGSDTKIPVENGKVSIMFGTHGGEEPKAEGNKVAESSLPKDAVDEWPEPKQIHSFYVVRYRPIEDQSLRAKLDVFEKELQKKNQARAQIVDKLKAKRAERSQLIAQLRSLGVENKQFRTILDEKRKEMEPLQQALGKLRGGSGGGRERSTGICSSEAELNDVIKSLEYRIQHESIPLTEEKQIMREIKQLEGTRTQVIAYAAERAKIQESMGKKEAIQDQVKLIGVGLDGVRKEKQGLNARIKQLDEEKAVIEKAIGVLEEELTALTEKRDKIFEQIKELRKQREDGNSPFYENRKMLSSAKELAAKKDVEALKELVDTEVEKFMSLWNSKKAFRDDYERRILPSLDMRQLSRDGRLRNPDEKPLMQVDVPTPSQPETVKASLKPPAKESNVPPPHAETTAEQKVKGGKSNKEGNKKSEINKTEPEEEEEVFTLGNKLPNNSVTKSDEVVDEKKLKELKRVEEIAKRNQAEERKKKLAEKAAVKAAIKAQKEADKKLKEREKRARKKSGATGAPTEAEEPSEAVAEVAEEEKMEEKIETPAPQKSKERKETNIRSRARARGSDSLPKAILKRKKATNYWLYAGSAAAVVLIVLITVGYGYLT